MQKRIALITGATSGIGEATAHLLAQNNFNLILCGRREDRLIKLKTELSSFTEVVTLSFDVRDKHDVRKAITSLSSPWNKIDVLINNAGNAHGLDPIQTGNLDDWDAMMDINVKGLLYVSHEVLPIMVERKSGHIINIGSIFGVISKPKRSIYSVAKHGIHGLTVACALDLAPHGILVNTVSPGFVLTDCCFRCS